jgi:hypothetical protein
LLDRRVDPSQSVELTQAQTPLRDIVSALAQKVEAEMTVVGNVVYVGPRDSVNKLRTLVELRSIELSKLSSGATPGKSPWRNRPVPLTQKKTFVWRDFDRPRDILKQVADKFHIEFDGLEKVPHDLWAAGSLPQVSATEARSLLLVQFGSTFEFVPDRAAVRIVPIPPRVVIERSYALPASPAETVREAREKFGDAEFVARGTKLIVQATIEQHAEIAEWLKPGGSKPIKSAANKPSKLLSERRFELKQRNAPIGDVIKTFIAFGVKIEYDPERFADAGISLATTIDIDVKDVSAEKLFRDHFEPLGIEVTIDGEMMRLRPKPK